MKRPNLPLWLSLLCAAVAISTRDAEAKPARQRVLMDDGWRFHRGDLPGVTNQLQGIRVEQWRWIPGEPGSDKMADPSVDAAGDAWHDARVGQDVFYGKTGYAWFRAVLPKHEGPNHVLHFESVDDNATVYLNGMKLASHSGWNDAFDVDLTKAWKQSGPNVLAVFVENTGGGGGIGGPVAIQTEQLFAAPTPSAQNYDDRSWTPIHLPHDYVIEGGFDPKGDASHGSIIPTNGWYRKVFKIPGSAKGKSLWLDFDGVYRNSFVWLNGKFVGRHQSGYTSFRCDITQAANYGGKNVLVVSVDPRSFEGWWYEGGGIYRHVWLNIADPVHIEPWGTFVTTDLPEPESGAKPAFADVTGSTVVTNTRATGFVVTVISQLVDQSNKVVATMLSSTNIGAGSSGAVVQSVRLGQPHLWSTETPYLYHLVTTVKHGRRIIDSTQTPFGIRTIRFDAEKGLMVNGSPVKIKGVCNHQDFAGVGVALPDTLQFWRVKKLKEMGANAWRMSHNPPNPELLDACDQLGMLVMDENRHLGDSSDIQAQVASMVLRDRNHPSVIMWSMCNEESRQGTPEGARLFSGLAEVVRCYDTTRSITAAMHGGWFEPVSIAKVDDLVGVNYSPNHYDAIHKAHPGKPMYASETASTLTTRGEYRDDKSKTFVSSYNMTDGSWAPVAERSFVAGSFVWTGFDYKGEPTPYTWPCINSHFGIFDICGFPKDNYYYYCAWWKTNPVVHVMPHWNWQGTEGQATKVVVFSNCEKVELFLNGQSLGTKEMPRNSHLEWAVNYAPGRLEAKGYNGGAVTATDEVQTTGVPAGLRLKTDRTVINANGEDLTVVEVDVVDAQGRIVPTACDRVDFAVKGAGHIAGVGNGDPGDHDPDRANNRRAFNGKCMVLVGAGEKSGKIELTATSGNLKPVTMKFRAKKL